MTKEKRKVALESAEKSMVLLKNEGILPLNRNAKIGILGTLANQRGEMTGTWAIRAEEDDCVSIVDACERQEIDYLYTDVIEETKYCDVLLLVLGENKNESGEAASKANISLPAEQLELLRAAKKTGKPVVVILFNGRPLAIPEVHEYATAILEKHGTQEWKQGMQF